MQRNEFLITCANIFVEKTLIIAQSVPNCACFLPKIGVLLLSPHGIFASELFKGLGVLLEFLAVCKWVVILQQACVWVGTGCEGMGQGRRCDTWRAGQVEVAAQSFDNHVVGIHLAVGTVACDVWCANPHALEQWQQQTGLVFPCIDHRLSYLIIYKELSACCSSSSGQVGVAVGGCFVFVLLLPELFCCGRYVLYAETKVLLTICLNSSAKLIQNVIIRNKNQSK